MQQIISPQYKNLVRFELDFSLRQPFFYIAFVAFFLLAFIATAGNFDVIGDGNHYPINAPYHINSILIVCNLLGLFLVAAFATNPLLRDRTSRISQLLFANPLATSTYFGGRLTGATVITILAFSGAFLGMLIGGKMPWLAADLIGDTNWAAYWFTFYALVLPNFLVTIALTFAVVAWTCKAMPTYMMAVAIIMLQFTARALNSPDLVQVGALLDPFGISAVLEQTRYWVIEERQNKMLSLDGSLLYNRLIWLVVAASVLLLSFSRFNFSRILFAKEGKKAPVANDEAKVRSSYQFNRPSFDFAARWGQFAAQTRLQLKQTVLSWSFWIALSFGIANMVNNTLLNNLDRYVGTDVLPVTNLMLRVIDSSYIMIVLVLLSFYAGEIVWREKTAKIDQVMGALPVSNNNALLAKLTSLLIVVFALLGVSVLTAIGIQLAVGFDTIEPMLYFKGIFLVHGGYFLIVAVLALFLQVLTNNKYFGLLLMLVYLVLPKLMETMGWFDYLYRFDLPTILHSDMAGFGPYVAGRLWYNGYWIIFCGLLMLLAAMLWTRGGEATFKSRLNTLKSRFNKVERYSAATLLIAFLACGGYIYHNTHQLNNYLTKAEREQRAVDYERSYSKYTGMTAPAMSDLNLKVDIYPQARDVDIKGSFSLTNNSTEAIETIHISMPYDVAIKSMDFAKGSSKTLSDETLGYHIFKLQQPLLPGAKEVMSFELQWHNNGFKNHAVNRKIISNGTSFSSWDILPFIGYREWGKQLQDTQKRKEYGLPAVEALPTLASDKVLHPELLTKINVDIKVSTAQDQVAVAPGVLKKQWTENNRAYYLYRSDQPIYGLLSFVSARYEQQSSQYKGVDLAVFYHKPHHHNLDSFNLAMKDTLDFFNQHIAPMPTSKVSVVEVPRYSGGTSSFPNMIAFSESQGFIADLRDENDFDYVYYATINEMVHQWWGLGIAPAYKEGYRFLTESLSGFSALLVAEQRYGKAYVRKLLKRKRDSYLKGRGREKAQENPLYKAGERQYYVYGSKGAMALYALRDYIGTPAITKALSNYYNAFYNADVSPTSLDLLNHLRQVTPAKYQTLVTELFEQIVLHDLSMTEAVVEELPDGKYEVTMTVNANKLIADGQGRESRMTHDLAIEIGVFGPWDPKTGFYTPIKVEKHVISEVGQQITFVVDEKPRVAGVNPYRVLIERNASDNLVYVEAR